KTKTGHCRARKTSLEFRPKTACFGVLARVEGMLPDFPAWRMLRIWSPSEAAAEKGCYDRGSTLRLSPFGTEGFSCKSLIEQLPTFCRTRLTCATIFIAIRNWGMRRRMPAA